MRRLSVTITTLLLLVLTIFPVQAWSREPVTPEMTLQMAVEKALANSDALKNSKSDIKRAEEVRDFLGDKLDFVPNGPVPSSGVEKTYFGITQSYINYNMSKRNYKVTEDTVAMSVYQAYNGIIQAREKVSVAELNVKNKDWLERMAFAGKRVGTVDSMGMIQAETNYTAAKNSLEAAQKSLDDAYQKFNQLVGLWPEDRPVLSDMPEITPLNITDLDVEVSRVVDSSPAVWLAEQKVDLADLTMRLYDFTESGRTEPYKAKEIDVDKAKVTAGDTRDQTFKLVRTIYYSAKQLEEQNAAALETVRQAEEALRVAKVKYDVGMATKADLLNAGLALAQARQTVLDTAAQHEVMVYAFYKPWAYAGASGQ